MKIKQITIAIFLLTFLLPIETVLSNEDTGNVELLHLVVLADVSGSLETEDTKKLQLLTNQIPKILNNQLLSESKFSVVAFASEALQVCQTETINEYRSSKRNSLSNCLEQIQSIKKDNQDINLRADVGLHTNQVKAFEVGLDIISSDEENYIPVFLLLTDGKLDPIGDANKTSSSVNSEFDRGYLEVSPKMKNKNIQLFTFGFGNVALEDLTKWESFGAQPRSCQIESPEKIYLEKDDITKLLISINEAMNQVTCGLSSELITLTPGQPKDYKVSDLVQKLSIKIDLNGTQGVSAIVKSPSNIIVTPSNTESLDSECAAEYVTCYEIENPQAGNWTLDAKVASSNATTSFIVANVDLEGSFYIKTDCELTNGNTEISSCTFSLLPSRPDSTEINKAIDSVAFNFTISGTNIQEQSIFYSDVTTVQTFRNTSLDGGQYEIIINPIYSDFNLNDGYSWLELEEREPFSLAVNEGIVSGPVEEAREPISIPNWLYYLPLILGLIYIVLTQRKRNIPYGKVEAKYLNGRSVSTLYIYDQKSSEIGIGLNFQDDILSLFQNDGQATNMLILKSEEKIGINIFDNRSAKLFKFVYEDYEELGSGEVEIEIDEKYIVIFQPDEDSVGYESNDFGDDFVEDFSDDF